eukprot:g11186.t1
MAVPWSAVMEKEGGTAFGQQTLKRAILQASTEVSKTIRCKATWGPDMAQRLARLKHATDRRVGRVGRQFPCVGSQRHAMLQALPPYSRDWRGLQSPASLGGGGAQRAARPPER